jgi:uncharacterized membrane protein YhaH (DUF805 family)
MLDWMLLPYKRYADFSGRSRRKEYWLFTLFQTVIAVVLVALLFAGMPAVDEYGVAGEPGMMVYVGGGLLVLFFLATIVPSLACQVRRMHDQDKSGWFILLGFVPYIGGIIMLVFMCLDGTRGPNRFGEDPKDPNSADVFA